MDATNFDITVKIGELFCINTPAKPAEWQMYSFDRPARILWNAVGKRLADEGWSEKRIKEWLQSKYPRWALDGSLGERLEALGIICAERIIAEREGPSICAVAGL